MKKPIPRMFFIQADVTIQSKLSVGDLAQAVSSALDIPPLHLDISGRYEEGVVHTSSCLGLKFDLAKDDPPLQTYHLSINSDVDAFDYDGSETEIDGMNYLLGMLLRAGIDATPRDPKLLYGE